MKKYLNLILVVVFVFMGGMIFTACGGSGKIKDVTISFYQENVNFMSKSTNESTKTHEYELKTSYGTLIDMSNFHVYATKTKGDNFEVGKEGGYTLDAGNFSLSGVQPTGNYTLKFGYKGWTNIVNVVIEKQVVTLPSWKSDVEIYFEGVKYDGGDYTQRIDYNPNVMEMLESDVERIEPKENNGDGYSNKYNIEFRLIDEVNYKWPENSNTNNGNFVFDFIIEKELFITYLNDYYDYMAENDDRFTISSNDQSFNIPKSQLNIGVLNDIASNDNNKKIKINGQTIENLINSNSDLLNKFEFVISDDLYNPNSVTEITEGKIQYYLMLRVKDAAHSEVVKTTNPNDFKDTHAFVGNPRDFICIANINVTN